MPAPTTSEEFLDLVKKSGVVDAARLQSYVDRLRETDQIPPTPEDAARQLIQDGVITHFQAEQFRAGRWRRFTIGKYKVLEKLGAGGMGTVYLCEHMLMRRRVAIKVLPPTKVNDSSSLERFHREARAVATLDHPNIVRAYDIGEDDKLHFFVMEHVDGSSLQEIIKKTGPMDPVRVAHYMRQSAFGLQHAHETAALVHRDIKPGNILVDRGGVVKILDMGLARFFHDDTDDLTKKFDENVLGTADYLAPEQALDSHAADIRADIYSLGGTFYFCLTGRTPFTDGSVAQKLIWHQTRQPKPIRSFRPEVPEGLVAILDKMMAKDKAERYQTPQELADVLAEWTQTPIPPPPEDEMPQFSLAARASGSMNSDTGMSSSSRSYSETTSMPPPARKTWPAASPPTPKPAPSRAPVPPVSANGMPPAPPAPTDEPLDDVEIKPDRVTDVRKRGFAWKGAEKLPRWALLAAAATVPLCAILIWMLFGTGDKKGGAKGGREPIRVGEGLSLEAALRKAVEGDRFLICGDITEGGLSLTKVSNVVIEAEPGKKVTWRFPDDGPPGAKLILVNSAPGFALRGITLDGAGKAEALVTLYGSCPGASLSGLELRGLRKYGVVVANCEGSAGAPIRFSDLTIDAGPGQVGIFFDAKANVGSVKRNAHFVLSGLKFSGGGTKLGSPAPDAAVDLELFQMPGSLKVERINP